MSTIKIIFFTILGIFVIEDAVQGIRKIKKDTKYKVVRICFYIFLIFCGIGTIVVNILDGVK